nr:ribonuclease III domain-containing protein [Nitrosomonas sp.]
MILTSSPNTSPKLSEKTRFNLFFETIGYSFKELTLLREALTHRSFGLPNNERLEFLGDSVLNCAISGLLFKKFPTITEGDLSRIRSNLVNQSTLFNLALSIGIADLIRLGEGEKKSGGNNRPSILANALEAILGA